MKVTKIRNTAATEIVSNSGDFMALVSYQTIVAYHDSGTKPRIWDRPINPKTGNASPTTTKHINEWLARHDFKRERTFPATAEQLSAVVAMEIPELYNLESAALKLERVSG